MTQSPSLNSSPALFLTVVIVLTPETWETRNAGMAWHWPGTRRDSTSSPRFQFGHRTAGTAGGLLHLTRYQFYPAGPGRLVWPRWTRAQAPRLRTGVRCLGRAFRPRYRDRR